MKIDLKPYQEAAVSKVLKGLRRGSVEWLEDDDHTAVSLSAPTASGKTVIAAAVIERVFFGDPDAGTPADPETTFLWLTDDPSLNEQTRKKILAASDRIQSGHLVTVADGFDQPEFDPNTVYFLNIQKLASSSNLVRRAEGRRSFPIWETISNTISHRGASYYLVRDEAHRGSGVRFNNRQTLAQRLTSGEEGFVPPSPVVLGISATPTRFDEEMAGASPSRLSRRVEVPAIEVRESGLIKDVLSIHHRSTAQQIETTLLREAVRDLKELDAAWSRYCAEEGEPVVLPALVIQIPPSLSSDSVGDLLDVCTDEWNGINEDNIAHALESHATQEFGKYSIRYIAPQDIQDSLGVRVVLFKEALTTGWDCPRAEVMVSFRVARDDTYIAQLIGRMVRSPLAHRIESNETLNRVALYLPNFDRDAVLEVKSKLESGNDGAAAEIVIDSTNVARNMFVQAEVFDALQKIPSYLVPGAVHRSQVGRLHKLASLLVGDSLMDNAVRSADSFLAQCLDTERSRLEDEGSLIQLMREAENARVSTTEIGLNSGASISSSARFLDLDVADLDKLFSDSRTRLRDGLHNVYWRHRVTNFSDDSYEAKVLVVALSRQRDVVDAVEARADSRVQQWLNTYGDAIAGLSADRRSKYSHIRAMARAPELSPITLPSVIGMSSDDDAVEFRGHVFATKSGVFRVALGSWERHVLSVERDRSGFLGWYRNPVGGVRALRVPYIRGDGYGKMYPDFVFFHRGDDGSMQVSVVDPHGHHLSDAGPKLRGLCEYANRHRDSVARVLAVTRIEDTYRCLDLADEAVRLSLADVDSKDEIEKVFIANGIDYA